MTHVRRARDGGETLIEVLATVIILGTAIAALVAGISTAILASVSHRENATSNALLRSYAEAVKQTARAAYRPCDTAYPVSPSAYTPVNGWATPTNTIVNACPGGNDPGTQQVTITVTSPKGVVKTLDIWVRSSNA